MDSESPLVKSNLWSHIVEEVGEIAIDNNEDEFGMSLCYDEDYTHRINIEREAYKRGFIKAIEVLFLD